jgi:hypothetical protein
MSASPQLEERPSRPLQKLLPFAVALGLIGFVLSRLDWRTFLETVQRVNYFLFFGFVLVFVLCLLLADCFATRQVYARAVARVPLGQLLVLRAASYLPSIINHHLGQAWLTYFLSKVYRAPLWRVAGATLLVYITIFGGLLLTSSSSLVLNASVAPWFRPLLLAVFVSGVLYMAAIRWRPQFLQRREALAPLFDVGVGGHLMLLLYRLPHLAILFLGNWLPFEIFGVHIPFSDALALIPLVMFVSALPITPQGLGTRDALAQQLFASYAIGATNEQRAGTVTAVTLTFALTITIVQLLLSPLFLARAYRLLGMQASSDAS